MFFAEKIINLIAPHTCSSCGREGSALCSDCAATLVRTDAPCCYRCSLPALTYVCKPCAQKVGLEAVWVAAVYTPLVRRIVHDFKFGRKQALADGLAKVLADTLPSLRRDAIVSFVPTASSRVRMRGYDQARLLAEALARELGFACTPLLRRSTQVRQVGASRRERLRQLENAFEAAGPVPPVIILVDDLITTGGTFEAAAKSLRNAGAHEVYAVAFAQKQ